LVYRKFKLMPSRTLPLSKFHFSFVNGGIPVINYCQISHHSHCSIL
jgi:hypothetical protein